MSGKAIDILKDKIAWEDLKPIGQCIVLVDEAGNHDLAERAAKGFLTLGYILHTELPKMHSEAMNTTRELKKIRDDCDAALKDLEEMKRQRDA